MFGPDLPSFHRTCNRFSGAHLEGMNFSPTGDFAVLLRSTEAAARLHWLHYQAREGIFAKKKIRNVGEYICVDSPGKPIRPGKKENHRLKIAGRDKDM